MPKQDLFKSLEFERIVLAIWLRNKGLRQRWVTQRTIVYEGLFADKIHKKIYKEAAWMIEKNPSIFEPKLFVKRLEKKLKPSDFEVALNIIKKIRKIDVDISSFPMFREDLQRMEEARKYLDLALEVKDDLKGGDIDAARDRVSRLLSAQVEASPTIHKGELYNDLEEQMQYFEDYRKYPEKYWGIATGIPLLDKITGGSKKGLFYLVVAGTKRGKSIFLTNLCHVAANVGKFCVFITTEIQKGVSQRRFISRRTSIPFDDLENPRHLSDKEENQIRESVYKLRKMGGLIYVVEFTGRSCTVPKIWSTCQILEQEMGRSIDLLAVDQLHDMTPLGRFASDRSWDAYGEISWDLASFAKDFRHIDDPVETPSGMPIWSACQAKTQAEFSKRLSRQDVAYSPLPIQHASYSVYLSATEEDEQYGRLRFGFVDSGRYGGSTDQQILYPNLDITLMHDPGREPKEKTESSEGEWE